MVFELTKGPQDKMGGLVVRARNKYTFLSTAGLLLTWHILLDGVPLMVGDPAQGDAEGWYPGGSVPLAPQVSLFHNPLLAGTYCRGVAVLVSVPAAIVLAMLP